MDTVYTEELSLECLEKNPKSWSKREVGQWLNWCAQTYALNDVPFSKFEMNGKALDLLSKEDFMRKSPNSGDVLYRSLEQHNNKFLVMDLSTGNTVQKSDYKSFPNFPKYPIKQRASQTPIKVNSPFQVRRAASLSTPPTEDSSLSNTFCSTDLNMNQVYLPFSDRNKSQTLEVVFPRSTLLPSIVYTNWPAAATAKTSNFSECVPKMTISSDKSHFSISQVQALKNSISQAQSFHNVSSTYDISAQPFDTNSLTSASCSERRHGSKISDKLDEDTKLQDSFETEHEYSLLSSRLLWQFLKEILRTERNTECVKWENKEQMIFRIVDPARLAALWGQQKGRPNMTYEKMSRAMRYYYKLNIMSKVKGHKLTYRFLTAPSRPRPKNTKRPKPKGTSIVCETGILDPDNSLPGSGSPNEQLREDISTASKFSREKEQSEPGTDKTLPWTETEDKAEFLLNLSASKAHILPMDYGQVQYIGELRHGMVSSAWSDHSGNGGDGTIHFHGDEKQSPQAKPPQLDLHLRENSRTVQGLKARERENAHNRIATRRYRRSKQNAPSREERMIPNENLDNDINDNEDNNTRSKRQRFNIDDSDITLRHFDIAMMDFWQIDPLLASDSEISSDGDGKLRQVSSMTDINFSGNESVWLQRQLLFDNYTEERCLDLSLPKDRTYTV